MWKKEYFMQILVYFNEMWKFELFNKNSFKVYKGPQASTSIKVSWILVTNVDSQGLSPSPHHHSSSPYHCLLPELQQRCPIKSKLQLNFLYLRNRVRFREGIVTHSRIHIVTDVELRSKSWETLLAKKQHWF